MKSNQSKYRSKRSSSGLSKRQLFIVAGAFLVSPLFLAPQVSAQSPEETKPAVELRPVDASPLLLSEKENELKIKYIEESYKVQSELVQEKLDEIEEAKKEKVTTSKAKMTLEEEIAAMKEDIAAMEARVAEKKALEAEQARLEAARAEAVQQVAPAAQAPSAPVSYSRGQSSNNVGNRYVPGQCTYYVYNRRPDIGSFWGNANQWLYSAQADGYSTGSAPAAGAIAVSIGGNHVAYVESVSGSTITISEMNYSGPWTMNTRTAPAHSFMYIY